MFPVLPCAGVGAEISLFVLLNDNGPLRVGQAGRQLFKQSVTRGSRSLNDHVCHFFSDNPLD